MIKLWNDTELSSVTPAVLDAANGKNDGISIKAVKFGLLFHIQREEHQLGGKTCHFVHVSCSVTDNDQVTKAAKELEIGHFHIYVEEIIQALFGYDHLLIEVDMKDGIRSPVRMTLISPELDPKKYFNYTYHWFYET